MPLLKEILNIYSISHFGGKKPTKINVKLNYQPIIHALIYIILKNKMEFVCIFIYTFTLLHCKIITAQKMQTHFFDFYYHFNPQQNYLTWFWQIGKTQPHDLFLKPMQNQTKIDLKRQFPKSAYILAPTCNFLKNFTSILE